MRKILLPVFAGFLVSFVSCNTRTTVAGATYSEQAQKNLDISHQVNNAYATGDASKMDSLLSTDFVEHSDRGDVRGIDSAKSMVNFVHNTFKDMKMDLVHEWADNDFAVSWMHYTGTNPTAMPGMAAGPFNFNEMEVYRFASGKIAEHWTFVEAQTMTQILKNYGVNVNTNTMDSSGMMHMDSSKMNMNDTGKMKGMDSSNRMRH
jgi:predicted SnoaL-like aldol condensation-catalyzing enzyme